MSRQELAHQHYQQSEGESKIEQGEESMIQQEIGEEEQGTMNISSCLRRGGGAAEDDQLTIHTGNQTAASGEEQQKMIDGYYIQRPDGSDQLEVQL